MNVESRLNLHDPATEDCRRSEGSAGRQSCPYRRAGAETSLVDFAALHMSAYGTKRIWRDDPLFVRFRGKADMDDPAALTASVADDPKRTSVAAFAAMHGPDLYTPMLLTGIASSHEQARSCTTASTGGHSCPHRARTPGASRLRHHVGTSGLSPARGKG